MRLASAEGKSSENGCFLPPASFPCVLPSRGDSQVSLDPDPSLPSCVCVDGPAPGSPLLCLWWEALVTLFLAPYLTVQGLAGASPRSPSSKPVFLEEQERGLAFLFPARALLCTCSGLQLLRAGPWNAGCGISSSGRTLLVPKLSLSESLCSNF